MYEGDDLTQNMRGDIAVDDCAATDDQNEYEEMPVRNRTIPPGSSSLRGTFGEES